MACPTWGSPVRHGKNNPASRPVSLAGWYRSRAVAVALGHRAERPIITIVHCQYAPRAGCSALRPGRTFLRRSRARVRCARVSPPSRPRHRPPRADAARSAVTTFTSPSSPGTSPWGCATPACPAWRASSVGAATLSANVARTSAAPIAEALPGSTSPGLPASFAVWPTDPASV